MNPTGAPSITDWLTTIATGVTAFAAGLGGLFAWRAYRRDTRHQLPIVELEFRDSSGNKLLRLLIRNRLPETIDVGTISIRAPRGATLHRDISEKPSQTLSLDQDVGPYGSTVDPIYSPPDRGLISADTKRIDLYVNFPLGWKSGNVAIDLLISSRALTLRDKRIVIKRFTTAPKAMKPEPTTQIQIPS